MDFLEATRAIHPFGCLCFVHVPRALRANTHGHPAAARGIYLGPSEVTFGHDVLVLLGRRVVRGAHSVFFVDQTFPLREVRDGEDRRRVLAEADEEA